MHWAGVGRNISKLKQISALIIWDHSSFKHKQIKYFIQRI